MLFKIIMRLLFITKIRHTNLSNIGSSLPIVLNWRYMCLLTTPGIVLCLFSTPETVPALCKPVKIQIFH